jgi:hypothetical protein
VWHEYEQHFPKQSRYTLGSKIDSLFMETLERVFSASYLRGEQKLPFIQEASNKFDMMRFFLQIAWETKAMDNKKYIALSGMLEEIGKMFGGWMKQVLKQTSARK